MKLLELRKQNNKTQQEIAELLQIKQHSYSQYELGKTQPNIENLIKLADYYNVSVDYLIDRKWHNDIGYLTPTQIECVNMIKQLNEINLTKLVGYLSAMISIQ